MDKIRQGDKVVVISGNGRKAMGTVRQVLPKEGRVIVAGINLVKKHQKPTGRVRTQVGIIEREAPIHLSNVALFCSHCDRRARVGFQVAADGSRVRLCKRCGEII